MVHGVLLVVGSPVPVEVEERRDGDDMVDLSAQGIEALQLQDCNVWGVGDHPGSLLCCRVLAAVALVPLDRIGQVPIQVLGEGAFMKLWLNLNRDDAFGLTIVGADVTALGAAGRGVDCEVVKGFENPVYPGYLSVDALR